ncbi:LysE family transporter [Planococcus shenhongbingii]|uniref:LysE family transporter n=1 Tax=Planococcus shenhongbingii TaxID=3058398 RepID=A0ABT8NHC1_9BACL|nr:MULTISPECIES: LysE family transporter [unclassified Planococcus (in: firmicutes)]MDN7246860.1 LysE family transporter [Planococcus sp. N017]WKA58785.1 LysE family transporter [Planococcus sp. N016]
MASGLLGFIILGFSLSVPVGAITIEMVKRGIQGGFMHAWMVGVGGMSADVVLMLLIYFGVSGFLTSMAAQTVLWLFGFVVLVYLGTESIKDAFRITGIDVMNPVKTEPLTGAYLSGFVIAISNPLNIIFWIGIYGSVLTSTLQNASSGEVLLYSIAIFIGIAIWDLVIAISVHIGKSFTGHRFMKSFSVIAGLALIGFGLSFGWQAMKNLMLLMN